LRAVEPRIAVAWYLMCNKENSRCIICCAGAGRAAGDRAVDEVREGVCGWLTRAAAHVLPGGLGFGLCVLIWQITRLVNRGCGVLLDVLQ
jgi:hypothetical protein